MSDFVDFNSAAKCFVMQYPVGTVLTREQLGAFLANYCGLQPAPVVESKRAGDWRSYNMDYHDVRMKLNRAIYDEEYDGERYQIDVLEWGKTFVVRTPDILAQTDLQWELARISKAAKRAYKECERHQRLAVEANLSATELATSALTVSAALMYGITDLINGLSSRLQSENEKWERRRIAAQRQGDAVIPTPKDKKTKTKTGSSAQH